ncbi:hypothetical protein [Lentzea waywayandensis]|nr:hypothetical protein [Lentzea waywayandensis]
MALAVGLIGLSAGTAVADPTAAAQGCWRSYKGWRCDNNRDIRVEWAGKEVGRLLTSPSWFKCRYEGDPTGGGGPHPNRWIYTQADTTANWGFVKDSDVISETNTLPTC